MIYHAEKNARTSSLDDLQLVVDKVARKLSYKVNKDTFDSIVVRGMSGVLVGAPVSLKLRKPLVVIRKGSERSHDSEKLINGKNLGARWLFLDDFTASGATFRACETAIATWVKRHNLQAIRYGDASIETRPVAKLMYRDLDLTKF